MRAHVIFIFMLVPGLFLLCGKSSEEKAQPAEQSETAVVEQASAEDTLAEPAEEAVETEEPMVAKSVDVKEEKVMQPAAKVQVKEPVKLEEKKLVPIDIKLPAPVFTGTPQNMNVPNLEKPLGKARPPFLAPEGTKNLALNKTISSSDDMPIIGSLELITDGDKEATDGSYVELGPFVQQVTVDLEQKSTIYAVVLWHFHKQPRVYFDVIVQVADDPDFTTNVKTLFNNDIDNSAGMGTGKEMHYVETSEGKLIDAKGVQARYLRCYSNGNNNNDLNHYIELEVYGIPAE
jgi:hypothetical protein